MWYNSITMFEGGENDDESGSDDESDGCPETVSG